MKKAAVIAWLAGIFLVIASLFWYNEWIYALPTPIPAHYKTVNRGTAINLPRIAGQPSRPVFLHFFNPDCPCSKFNIPQFKSLVRKYGGEVDFAVVLMTSKKYSKQQIEDRFGLGLPVFSDSSIAVACGVYSTPQAVLLGADHTLFYRGNYNRSRYCADPSTDYAGQALEALLHNKHGIVLDPLALQAYGCSLPNCPQ